jgi:hypothetical protein
MSTFEEELEQKVKESQGLDLDSLGDTIKGKVIRNEFKEDARANKALFFTIETKEGNVVQKYGVSLYKLLLEKIKACGGIVHLQTVEHTWKKEKAGRATFNRYYPIPNKELKK